MNKYLIEQFLMIDNTIMSDGEATPFVPEMSTYSWGRYDNGLLITPSLVEPSGSTIYTGKNFMEISSNLYTTCAVLNTGELYITGGLIFNNIHLSLSH